MVNVVKELTNIRPPCPAVAISMEQLLCTFKRFVQALSLTTRPNIIIKPRVNQGDEVVIEKPMYHSVTYIRNGNIPPFLLVHNPVMVTSMFISTGIEVGAES